MSFHIFLKLSVFSQFAESVLSSFNEKFLCLKFWRLFLFPVPFVKFSSSGTLLLSHLSLVHDFSLLALKYFPSPLSSPSSPCINSILNLSSASLFSDLFLFCSLLFLFYYFYISVCFFPVPIPFNNLILFVLIQSVSIETCEEFPSILLDIFF